MLGKGHFASLTPIGCGEALLPCCEEIGFGAARHLEKSFFDFGLGRNDAIGQNVLHRHTGALGEFPADQHTAMAIQRVALRAHQRDAELLRALDDALEPRRERIFRRHLLVVRNAVTK